MDEAGHCHGCAERLYYNGFESRRRIEDKLDRLLHLLEARPAMKVSPEQVRRLNAEATCLGDAKSVEIRNANPLAWVNEREVMLENSLRERIRNTGPAAVPDPGDEGWLAWVEDCDLVGLDPKTGKAVKSAD